MNLEYFTIFLLLLISAILSLLFIKSLRTKNSKEDLDIINIKEQLNSLLHKTMEQSGYMNSKIDEIGDLTKKMTSAMTASISDMGLMGEVILENILENCKNKSLVSLMHINNEIGSILDLERVGNLCKKYNSLFHSDTVQSIGKYKFNLSDLNIDFIVGSAHKFHGPKGIGFVYINKKLKLNPFIIGGNQERGMRAGTESVHNIVGMQTAFENSYSNLEANNKHILNLKLNFIKSIKKAIPKIKFNGSCENNLYSSFSILNICLPMNKDQSILLEFNLDIKGISCSRGSACQSGSNQGSHVLNSILSSDDLKKPSLRFSFSKYNKDEEISEVVSALKEFVNSN